MERSGDKMTILKASAGSGKTYTLAYRFIRKLIEDPLYVSHMLAVTFTNKATCQMKDKILESLQDLRENPHEAAYTAQLAEDLSMTPERISVNASRAQLEILSDYDGFAVSTIDKFFNRVVRSFFNELKKDPMYEVITSTTELMDRAILNVVLDPAKSAVLEPLFIQRTEEDGKNSDIRSNLGIIRDAILKLHDEGYDITGIKQQYVSDRSSLDSLLRRIRDLASRMLSYLLANGLSAEDYYGSGRGFITTLETIASGVDAVNSEGNVALSATFKKIASGETSPYRKTSPRRAEIEAMADRIRTDASELVSMAEGFDSRLWCTVSLLSDRINLLDTIKVIYDQYIADCEKDNVVAISEMPALVAKIARNSDLQFLYMKLGTLLETVMIDEFQDTSTEQWEGFRPILEEIFASVERPENLIIGDVKQAIYRWRNGNEELLRCRVAEEFSQSCERMLDRNFRSREAVVAFNNALYTSVAYSGECPVSFEGIGDVSDHLQSVIMQTYGDCAQKLGDPRKQKGGYVECSTPEIGSVPEKVTGLIRDILDDGYGYGDIAIIIRRNSEAEPLADALVDAGIPFISGESLKLSNAVSVKMMTALMHVAADRRDTQSIASYNCLVGRGPLTVLPENEKANLIKAATMSLVEAAAFLQREFDVTTDGETAYFDAFMDKVYSRYRDRSDSVADFVKWWDDTGKESKLTSPDGQDAVTIITVHKAKGLEYPVVIAPYVNWDVMPMNMSTVYLKADGDSPYAGMGTFPLGYSEKKMAGSCFRGSYLSEAAHSVVDNLNLLYVTTTRACDRLYMFCPVKKSPKRSISRFIISRLDPSDSTSAVAPSGNALNSPERIKGGDGDCPDIPFEFSKGTDGIFSFKAGYPEPKSEDVKTQPDVLTEQADDLSAGTFGGTLTRTPVFDPTDRRNIDKQKGTLMHRALSSATGLDDLEEKVREEARTAGLDPAEFKAAIERILSRPEMREWFDPKWTVYSERGIMIPGSSSGRRPDRVLTSGDRAVVIDYKFGTAVLDKYVGQVGEYMSLLRRMGYSDVTGYIYYVLLDRVVPVI